MMDSYRMTLAWLAMAAGVTFAGSASGAEVGAAKHQWKVNQHENTRFLGFSTSVPLLGKVTQVEVVFYADPTPSKNDIHSTLGFDFFVEGTGKLAAFNFEAFEGPDANPGRAMQITITRNGKPPLILKLTPSGASPSEGKFIFGLADMSRKITSESKTILKALADDALTMQIVVTDVRNANIKLALTIPVAERQADFKALLTGLK